MTKNRPPPEFGFRTIIEEASEGVIITRADPIINDGPEIVYVNRAMEHISGYLSSELIGRTPRILQNDQTSAETKRTIQQHLASKLPVRCRIMNVRKDGKHYWAELSIVPIRNQLGEVTHFASLQRDITDFKQLEDSIGDASLLDSQTSVLHNQAFLKALDTEWHRAYRHHSTFSVLCFRLVSPEKFPDPDDSQFAAIGKMCHSEFRKEDTIGRLSKFEFAVLMPETGLSLASSTINRLENRISQSARLNKYSVETGVAELNLLDETPDSVLIRAQQHLL